MKKRICLILTIVGLFQINNLYTSQADLGSYVPYVVKACKAGVEYATDCIVTEVMDCSILKESLNNLVDEYKSLGCGSSPACTENIRARHRILSIMSNKGCLSTTSSSSANSSNPLVTGLNNHQNTSPSPNTSSPKPPTTSTNYAMVQEAPLAPLD